MFEPVTVIDMTTDMTTDIPRTASELVSGTILPGLNWDELEDELVLNVGRKPGNPNIVVIETVFRTREVDWEFELKNWRTRRSGLVVDWREESVPPQAQEIYRGDVLPSPNPKPADSEAFELLAWKAEHFLVTRVVRHGPKSHKKLKISGICLPDRKPWQFVFRQDELVTFPRAKNNAPPALRSFHEFGPYVNTEDENDKSEYFFRIHPTGKGRWPNIIPLFSFHGEEGRFVSRPPAVRTPAWEKLEFVGDGPRHPYDPIEQKKKYDFYNHQRPTMDQLGIPPEERPGRAPSRPEAPKPYRPKD